MFKVRYLLRLKNKDEGRKKLKIYESENVTYLIFRIIVYGEMRLQANNFLNLSKEKSLKEFISFDSTIRISWESKAPDIFFISKLSTMSRDSGSSL